MSSSKNVSISKKTKNINENTYRKYVEETEDIQLYNKKVTQFFEMKNKWETRKNKKQSNCLICNNLTNTMTFEVSHDLYLAKCGKKICKPIEISRKTFISIDEKIKNISNKLNNLRQKFIIQKMDTMFNFIDDKNAIKVFKNEFEEYRELLKLYDEYISKYNTEEQKKNIDELNNKIYLEIIEINKLRDVIPLPIDDIIDIVNNNITPLINKLQEIQYPIMEMNMNKDGTIQLYQNTTKPQFIYL